MLGIASLRKLVGRGLRGLLASCAVFSFVALTGVLVLWGVSNFRAETWEVVRDLGPGPPEGPDRWARVFGVASYRHRIVFFYYPLTQRNSGCPLLNHDVSDNEFTADWWGMWGKGMVFMSYAPPELYPYLVDAHDAVWAVFLLVLPVAWIWQRWWLRQRKRGSAGLCLKCGYDLRAHKEGERCPECGRVIGGAGVGGEVQKFKG